MYGSSACNLQNLWAKITNNARKDQGSRQIQIVAQLTFNSQYECYDTVGSAVINGGTATYIQGDPEGEFILIQEASIPEGAFSGATAQNYYIQDVNLTAC